MAVSLRFQLPQLLLLISLFISAASDFDGSPSPSISPSLSPSSTVFHTPTHTYPPALFATILSTLGFQELSSAAVTANLSATAPLTIFAPSDASLLSCPSCSLSLLLQELSIPGLYPLHFLLTLTFGTKIETIAPNRCLTVTSNGKDKVFVNGVEITGPDVFNNGLVVIHGLQGFVSHLSPLSCNVERMTSLSFPSPSLTSAAPPSLFIMRLMLKDAIIRLRATGYSVVSLAMRVKYAELAELKAMTIFAIDDTAIFSGGGNAYLSNFRFHVVPNRRLTAADLVTLPTATSLPTLDAANNLVVTTGGGGGPAAPMKINYVRITTIDLLHNTKIVIHGLSSPFPHMMPHQAFSVEAGGSSSEIQQSAACAHFDWERGICAAEAQVPAAMQSAVELQDNRGL
ncbi:fasciclin-like arabinogalactan protein 21 [Salvia hispanica]|uniref:fasciclin-like arabinogalactan protein 21 n=1 Tax=Salvia hispanica TaxID=49212 RepID=UPI0020093B94|nr:fasciclin-like arabinogalactan protein 21 [Salvia hispanica]